MFYCWHISYYCLNCFFPILILRYSIFWASKIILFLTFAFHFNIILLLLDFLFLHAFGSQSNDFKQYPQYCKVCTNKITVHCKAHKRQKLETILRHNRKLRDQFNEYLCEIFLLTELQVIFNMFNNLLTTRCIHG